MSRRLPLCISLLVLLPGVAVRSARVSADSPVGPAAPTALAMRLPTGQAVAPGSWVSSSRIVFLFQTVGSGSLTPQVEVEPVSAAFTGRPSRAGAPVDAGSTAQVTVDGLANGTTYRWQARFVDSGGTAGPWTTFGTPSNQNAIRIDTSSPERPTISSPTDPHENAWYNASSATFRWQSADSGSGVLGYTHVLERDAHVIPPGPISAQSGATIGNLGSGTWFLAVRSVDHAGNWSPTATFRVQIDRVAPRLTWLSPRSTSLNPYASGGIFHFSVSKPADVDFSVYRVGSSRAVQTVNLGTLQGVGTHTFAWSGRDAHNKPLQRGFYFFAFRAVDHANNVTRSNLGAIYLLPQPGIRSAVGAILYPGGGKRIYVSLSRQTLYAYDGTHLALQTLVTTGNPNLPTPLGSYTILARFHPYEFISPWPVGSPYYYAPSPVAYAMLFRQGGYFLHDAPWRSVFGPGTNQAGQPGTNYGGTHGCVNMPPNATYFLWNWAPIGTSVQIVS